MAEAVTWNSAMQKEVWRLRNLGWNAAKIAAQFEGVTKGVMRQFIQSGNPPLPRDDPRDDTND